MDLADRLGAKQFVLHVTPQDDFLDRMSQRERGFQALTELAGKSGRSGGNIGAGESYFAQCHSLSGHRSSKAIGFPAYLSEYLIRVEEVVPKRLGISSGPGWRWTQCYK